MGFKLNIGKDGSGSTGFGKSSSEVMAKCKSMATYMGTLQDNITGGVDGGAGTPGGFSGNYGSAMNMNDGGTMAYQTNGTGGKKETIDEGPSGKSSTNRRKMTNAELLAKAKKEGVNTATLRKREAKEIAKQQDTVRNSNVTANSGNQMAQILSAGPNESDKKKKAEEMARGGKTN